MKVILVINKPLQISLTTPNFSLSDARILITRIFIFRHIWNLTSPCLILYDPPFLHRSLSLSKMFYLVQLKCPQLQRGCNLDEVEERRFARTLLAPETYISILVRNFKDPCPQVRTTLHPLLCRNPMHPHHPHQCPHRHNTRKQTTSMKHVDPFGPTSNHDLPRLKRPRNTAGQWPLGSIPG